MGDLSDGRDCDRDDDALIGEAAYLLRRMRVPGRLLYALRIHQHVSLALRFESPLTSQRMLERYCGALSQQLDLPLHIARRSKDTVQIEETPPLMVECYHLSASAGDGRGENGDSLLLRSAGLAPPFSYGEYGKPYISGGPYFSLTHSAGIAALAVCGDPVGLDAETIAPVRRAAARALTSEEREYMEADPERRFAYLWTRKEAALKCTGAGLSQPMNAFSVLGDTASPGGEPLSLCTVEYGDYMLSTAVAAHSAVFVPQRVDALALL